MTDTNSNKNVSPTTEPSLDKELYSDEAETKTAVALQYNHEDAPRVVAKGEGVIAEQIIAAAEEHGIYVQENPLLAQALGAVELDDEIPVELYTAVAEVIGFVLSLKGSTVESAQS